MSADVKVRVGARVRSLRSERQLTLKELAEKSGLSLRFASQLEQGKANISIGRLDGVARALDVPIAWLVQEDPPSGDLVARVQALLASRGAGALDGCLRCLEDQNPVPARRAGIALLGLRGAGKSTLGPRVAEALGLPFVELGDRIEELAGLGLSEIFSLQGEAYYRRLEGQALRALLATGDPCVVALPGGVVSNEEAYRLVRRRATTVWLKASPDDHMKRVAAQGDRRPMANSRDAMRELRELLAAREPLYRLADLSVDTSKLGEETLPTLLQALDKAGWSRS